jgi:hypothetical protein
MIFEVFNQGVILFSSDFLEIGAKKSNQLKCDD